MADILLVEDDDTLALSLEISLTDRGHAVTVCRTLGRAREVVGQVKPAVVVLDLGLPDGNGLDFCRELRDSGSIAPVLILTARGTLDARVEGLAIGADDYVTKPFELPELMARIEALLRRQGWHLPGEKVQIGALRVDFKRREAFRDDAPVELTELELEVLRYMLDRVDNPVSRGELLENVWGLDPSTRTRTVDVFVSRLRRHIEPDSARPRYLVNVRGVGYRLRLEAAS